MWSDVSLVIWSAAVLVVGMRVSARLGRVAFAIEEVRAAVAGAAFDAAHRGDVLVGEIDGLSKDLSQALTYLNETERRVGSLAHMAESSKVDENVESLLKMADIISNQLTGTDERVAFQEQ